MNKILFGLLGITLAGCVVSHPETDRNSHSSDYRTREYKRDHDDDGEWQYRGRSERKEKWTDENYHGYPYDRDRRWPYSHHN